MHKVIRAYSLSECMEIMAQYAEDYEKLGGENLVFCEDRLTLVAERAILRAVGGSFQTSVSTFSRLVKAEGKAVSKQGSVMLVGEVMTRLQRENKLQCFTSIAGVGKNAACIYETIAQFSASKITPEVLQDALLALPDDTLKKKISDLALIYERYSTALQQRGCLDESRYLTLLPKRIREERLLKGKNVFFLCYSSFTAQAKETVRAALETADNVVGIFCGGEEEIYTNGAFHSFKEVCAEYGKPLVADMGTPLEGVAENLRAGLFNPEYPAKPACTDEISIFEAEDKTLEAEYVAVKIKRATAENPALRFRDFAVLAPSVEEYALPLKKAFGEYGIPYFIDEKKSMKSHPLSKFLLDCFRVVKENYAPAAAQALASNYFFGESDEYRNYLLKFANYRGGAKRAIKTGEAVEGLFNLDRLENARARMLLATENIKARGYGRDYCQAVRKILTDFQVEKCLEKLDDALTDVAQKGYLAQISDALESVLSEAELLVGGIEMTAAEFAAILEDGFSAMEISLIPLKTDAVFIGDIAESRIEKVSSLFAVGLTDAVPRAAGDTAIVSDREIAKLAEVKALLEPTVAEVNLRSRESVCLNLCTFLDKLYLSYPLPADGEQPPLSEIFRYVKSCARDGAGNKLTHRKGFDEGDFPYKCSGATPAIRQMLLEKGEFERGKEDDVKACSAVFTALRRLGELDLDGYWIGKAPADELVSGGELFFHDGKISPTSLEGYFACPFNHFAARGLRLKEQDEATVLAVDTGNFIHLLLEKTAVKAKELASEAEMRAYATEVGSALLQSSVYLLQQDTKSGAYSLDKLLKEGVDVAVASYRQIVNSDFEVERTEAEVESDWLIGKVDRIDGNPEYVRIVDYKTGKIDESPTAYYTGRKLQMQLYMSELKGDRKPAGVFYFPASVDYVNEEDNDGRYRMKGFLNGEEGALRAGDKRITENAKSEYFSASLKNTASQTKIMDERTFEDFLAYGVLVGKQGVKEINEGFIAPTPYEGGCKYCKYGGMCGFNRKHGAIRKEEKIKPAEIAKIAREGKEE